MKLLKDFLVKNKIKYTRRNTKFHETLLVENNNKFIQVTLCNYTDLTHNYHIYTTEKDFYVENIKQVIDFISK